MPHKHKPPTILETSFAVEGIDANNRWALVGFSDGRRELNPCPLLEDAKVLLSDLEFIAKTDPRNSWKGFRVVKTTRELVPDEVVRR
jgi:hypothetical protein